MSTAIKSPKWIILGSMMAILVIGSEGVPKAQNPFEDIASHALFAMNTAAEVLINGAEFKEENGVDLLIASTNGNTDIGFGNTMLNLDDDSSEERKRKRRSVPIEESKGIVSPNADADCHGGTAGGGTAAGGADDVDTEAARRRAKARAQRKRSATQKKSGKKASKSKANGRRRKRQAEGSEMADEAQNVGKQIGERAKQFVEKVGNVFQALIESMKKVGDKIKQTFAGDQGGANDVTILQPVPENF